MLDSFGMTRPKRGRSLSLPQNTQNGLWPSQNTQKVLGIKEVTSEFCVFCVPRSGFSVFCGKNDGGGFYCPDERIISNSAEFVNGEG